MINTPSTYKFLPKWKKDIVDFIDEPAMQDALLKGKFAAYVDTWSTLARLFSEGQQFSEDRLAALLHPLKVWGRNPPRELIALAGKTDLPQNEVRWLTRAQREVLADVNGDTLELLVAERQWTVISEIANVLRTHAHSPGLSEGQQEFLDLAESLGR